MTLKEIEENTRLDRCLTSELVMWYGKSFKKHNMKNKTYKIYGIIQTKETVEYQKNEIVEVSLWKRNLAMNKRKGQKIMLLTTLEPVDEDDYSSYLINKNV